MSESAPRPPVDLTQPATITPQPLNPYLRTRVLTASPEELRLLLLDGAIKFAMQGRDGMVSKDFEKMYLGFSQCRNIIFELMTTVREDLAPEVVGQIKSLYTFMYTHLLEASHEKSEEKVDAVIKLLEYERETWSMAMAKLASERAGGESAAALAQPTMPLNAPAPAVSKTAPATPAAPAQRTAAQPPTTQARPTQPAPARQPLSVQA
jgi:flagellar protein FliS